MAEQTPIPKPRTLFVGLATPEFNARVSELAEPYFNIVEFMPPTGMPGGHPLLGPGVVPHHAVIVSFSPEESSPYPLEQTIDSVVNAFPKSDYYFVFPDDQPQDPLEPLIDKILDGRIPSRSVLSLRNFASAFEWQREGLLLPFESAPEELPKPFANDQVNITFDPSLSPEQIKSTLTALADYYRACGGVGLSVEFENQEAVPEEVHA